MTLIDVPKHLASVTRAVMAKQPDISINNIVVGLIPANRFFGTA